MEKVIVGLKIIYGDGQEKKAIFSDNNVDQTIGEFIETFIRPLLLSVGYSEANVNDEIGEIRDV